MFAITVLYGFALPSDLERMKARLLSEHGIQVNECRRESNAMLADDDSQIICKLYRVPANIRHDETAAAQLLRAVRDMILEITLVKTVIVVDSMEDVVTSRSQQAALAV
ncbi:MAG: hypothetical protein Q8S35_01180 [bacterium]|nr:hypothetical protein [bacterium]